MSNANEGLKATIRKVLTEQGASIFHVELTASLYVLAKGEDDAVDTAGSTLRELSLWDFDTSVRPVSKLPEYEIEQWASALPWLSDNVTAPDWKVEDILAALAEEPEAP